MVCLAEDLVVWKDFPKGLRVLLIAEDGSTGAETRSRLESMDYIVSLYSNEDDALEAIARKEDNFHVAILVVSTTESSGGLRFLEVARELPIIVVSDVQNLSITMKCIALGAAEFLQRPVSEDKLRNIWQHVVYKAFNAGGNALSKSLKPVKETVISMLRLQPETAGIKIEIPSDLENSEGIDKGGVEETVITEKFVEPSTPQFDRGERLPPTKDDQDTTNCSIERGSAEDFKGLEDETKSSTLVSKSVDNTCTNVISVCNAQEPLPSKYEEVAAEEEVNSANDSNTDECSTAVEGSQPSSQSHNVGVDDHKKKKKNSILNDLSCSNNKTNKKKIKVDWTPELHKKFVQAVEQLGIDQAIPSKILELMKVEGLTRHNIASHLQKYRLHKRHILPKNDDRRWQIHNPTQRSYMPKPILAYPSLYPNYNLSQSPIYPVWGHVSYPTHGYYLWPHAGLQTWHPTAEASSWKDNSGFHAHADAWGCPVVPQYGQYHLHSPRAPMRSDLGAIGYRNDKWKSSCEHLAAAEAEAEAAIDETVKEAISKPWLPLPLGLKPPSVDVVLSELHRQGIPTVPPPLSPATACHRRQ